MEEWQIAIAGTTRFLAFACICNFRFSGAKAEIRQAAAHDRLASEPDFDPRQCHFRFTPDSGHSSVQLDVRKARTVQHSKAALSAR
jgi:hypothetical protein